MKKTSKLLSVVMALVLMLSVIPVSSITASAAVVAPEIKLIPDKAAANVGEVVTIYVTIPENSRICSLSMDLRFNEDEFELVNAVSFGRFDTDMLNPEYTSHSIRFVGTDTTYMDDEQTVIFAASFKVREECCDIYAVFNELYVIDENDKVLNVTLDSNILCNPVVIHQPVDENVILAPTCVAAGYKTYNCPCGVFVEEHTPATGHKFENGVCVVCGEPVPVKEVTVSIPEPSRKELRSKDGIILYAVLEGDTKGTMVVWTASDSKNFETKTSGNDLIITARRKGYTTFTANVYGPYGEFITSASIEMYSKAGFFDRIGGFFRELFGTTKIYEH